MGTTGGLRCVSLTARSGRNLLHVGIAYDSLQFHREVHLETGGQLHLFMQAKACCGEAPEVALSVVGHRTLLEGAHLLGRQLTVSEGQGRLPERPSELCPLAPIHWAPASSVT